MGLEAPTLAYNGSTYTEAAWNNKLGSTGGGYSILFDQPSYQTAAGISNSIRSVPDVAMVADPDTGVYVYYNGSYYAAAGTSLGAPIWAAIIADCAAANPSISLTNNYLYGKVYGASGSSVMYKPEFNDLTSGNNGYYYAGTGWMPYPESARLMLLSLFMRFMRQFLSVSQVEPPEKASPYSEPDSKLVKVLP